MSDLELGERLMVVCHGIGTIQNDTDRAVETMTGGRTIADETQQLSTETDQEMAAIEHMVVEISGIASEILDAMHQQEATAAESQSAIDALVNLDSDTLTNQQSIILNKEDLAKLGDTLRDKLNRFSLSNAGWDESIRVRKSPQPDQMVAQNRDQRVHKRLLMLPCSSKINPAG